MKTIINYFKKRQERRLRAKIALNASYGVNDLNAVYEFVKNEPPMITRNGYAFTDKFTTTIDGGLVATAGDGGMNFGAAIDDYFNKRSTGVKADDGGMTFIDGSFCNNAKNL